MMWRDFLLYTSSPLYLKVYEKNQDLKSIGEGDFSFSTCPLLTRLRLETALLRVSLDILADGSGGSSAGQTSACDSENYLAIKSLYKYKAVSHLHTFQNVLLQIIRNQSPWPVKLVRRLGVFSEDSSLAHPPIPVILLSHDCDIEQPLQFLRTQLFFFRVPLRSDKLISTFSRVCPWFYLFVSNGLDLASKLKN